MTRAYTAAQLQVHFYLFIYFIIYKNFKCTFKMWITKIDTMFVSYTS